MNPTTSTFVTSTGLYGSYGPGVTAVRTLAGWRGQVLDYATQEILWESKPKKTQGKAFAAAERARLAAAREMFQYV